MIPIPAQYRLAAKAAGWALVALALLAIYSWIWHRGAAHVQARWDAVAAEQAKVRAEQAATRAEVSTEVVSAHAERVRVIREKGEVIIREVPVYVPAGSCDLPSGFRVHHDAAAAGVLPDPAGIADADPAAAQAVAEAVADNYATCHANAEQLSALQEWVRKQAAVE